MWWFTLPVIIYAAGLLLLRQINSLHRLTDLKADDKQYPVRKAASPIAKNPVSIVTTADGIQELERKDPATAFGGMPGVSIVIAARNEEKQITSLLGSLARQDYPADLLEIIIVNDNSTDRTPIVVSEFIAGQAAGGGNSIGESDTYKPVTGNTEHSVHRRIKLFYNPYPGKKRAVRYGIEKATGEIILTTDADCITGPGWVRSHARWYASDDEGSSSSGTAEGTGSMLGESLSPAASAVPLMTDMVLGPVVQRAGPGFWSHFGVLEFSALQTITEAAAAAGHPVMCNAANMSIRREAYLGHVDELRFDLESGDDMFLLQAVLRDGGIVRHDGRTAAAAVTAGAVTAAALLRQRARWASKTFHYRDAATLSLAAATAACNAAVAAAAVAAFMSVKYLPLAAALYAVKTIPDYLLIAGELRKRGNRLKALPFIASEIIYPFWFLTVGIFSLMPGSGRFARR